MKDEMWKLVLQIRKEPVLPPELESIAALTYCNAAVLECWAGRRHMNRETMDLLIRIREQLSDAADKEAERPEVAAAMEKWKKEHGE